MEVRELAERLEAIKWSAISANDSDALASIFTKDLYYLHSSGVKDDAASYLKQMRNGSFVYHSINHQLQTFASLGDHSLLTAGVVDINATICGKLLQMHSRFISVWVCEVGKWKLMAQQTTASGPSL